jgi:hypothetical protein
MRRFLATSVKTATTTTTTTTTTRRGVHRVRGPADVGVLGKPGSAHTTFAQPTTKVHRFLSDSPPAEPRNFGAKFQLPKGDTSPMILQDLNGHPFDKRVNFDEDAHVYYVDSVAMEVSVTGLIEGFFEKFDADQVAARMVAGSRWPRDGYTHKDGTPYTEAEIKAKWDTIGVYARNRGTWMHYNIERFLNNLQFSSKVEEMRHFLAFYEDFIKARDLQPFRTEWRIAAAVLSLAGSVDFVGRFPDGTYALLDWKRAKNLEAGLQNNFNRKAAYPLEHLDDCEGNKYFLQLNMYKHLLERYYGVNVSYMGVVSLHPNLPSYFLADAPVMADEVDAMIEEHKRRRAERHQQQQLQQQQGPGVFSPAPPRPPSVSSPPTPVTNIPF